MFVLNLFSLSRSRCFFYKKKKEGNKNKQSTSVPKEFIQLKKKSLAVENFFIELSLFFLSNN